MLGLAGEVEAQVKLLADEMMGFTFRLAGIVALLPLRSHETSVDDLDENHPADLRSRLLCLLADHIRPAATGLRMASSLRSAEVAEAVFESFDRLLAPQCAEGPAGEEKSAIAPEGRSGSR